MDKAVIILIIILLVAIGIFIGVQLSDGGSTAGAASNIPSYYGGGCGR